MHFERVRLVRQPIKVIPRWFELMKHYHPRRQGGRLVRSVDEPRELATYSSSSAALLSRDVLGGMLIVVAEDIDVVREPRLVTADAHHRGQSVDQVLVQLEANIDHVVILACGNPCPFLGADNKCTIYPTRPNSCVGGHAGR